MKPVVTLGETRTPDGSRFSLHVHDGEFSLKLNGTQLMSSCWTTSELLLADYACKGMRPGGSALIGGLGLGYSLKRVLELCGKKAKVVQAELLQEVVDWNREFLMDVNGQLLDDARVKTYVGDVFQCINDSPTNTYDAILLDVDNGPTSFVQPENARLYQDRGFAEILRSLYPGGNVAFWSADPEPKFMKQLRGAGFRNVVEYEAKAHERAKRAAHRIYVGSKPE